MNLLTYEFLEYVIRLKFSVTVYLGISYDLIQNPTIASLWVIIIVIFEISACK